MQVNVPLHILNLKNSPSTDSNMGKQPATTAPVVEGGNPSLGNPRRAKAEARAGVKPDTARSDDSDSSSGLSCLSFLSFFPVFPGGFSGGFWFL